MASGTLERCSLHRRIPVFTVQGRWQTAYMASCGWAVYWCQHCGSNGPWWWWGYGMGRRMLWTTNTGAFYWWRFECPEITWRDPEAHCCAIHPQPSPHVTAWWSWKHPSSCMTNQYSPDMSPIEHVWDALDRRIRQHVPVPVNIQQLCTAIEEEWTNILQATINNLINSMRRRCVALREANGVMPDTDWFSDTQYSKTVHFRVFFYCDAYTCMMIHELNITPEAINYDRGTKQRSFISTRECLKSKVWDHFGYAKNDQGII